jgi:hypothetical protein
MLRSHSDPAAAHVYIMIAAWLFELLPSEPLVPQVRTVLKLLSAIR